MTVGRGPPVYETGADVVATRVPLQLLKVPVLQPPGIPVAWTVTACGPGATGVNETKVLCPGASGSEVKIEPSTPIATWMSEQWLGEAVNWSWAMPSEVMEVVKVGSQVSPMEVQVTAIGWVVSTSISGLSRSGCRQSVTVSEVGLVIPKPWSTRWAVR